MTRPAPHDRRLSKLADLQALTSQSQANDVSQQDSDMRALQTLYGISQDATMSPEKLHALQLSNEAAGYKNAWFQPQAEQQHELGQATLERAPYELDSLRAQTANLPLQGALLGAQANHLVTDSAETNARMAAGEPTAKVNLMNSQAKYAALGPTLGYYAQAIQAPPTYKTPQFIQDLGSSFEPPKDPTTMNLEYAKLYGDAMAKNNELQKQLRIAKPPVPTERPLAQPTGYLQFK